MGEEIRKILEALQNGEITADEAEAFINAIKQKEKESRSRNNTYIDEEKSETKIDEKIVIEEGEIFDGDINIVNGEAIIKGSVNGDCSVVFGKLMFSGEVRGDMNVVGSKVEWNGGIIHGSLNIVGSKESGTPPKIEGGLTRFNNFALKGVFKFLKPFLKGLEIKNGGFKKKIEVQKFETLVVEEGEVFSTKDDIEADVVIVKGKLACGNLTADEISVLGSLSSGNIEADKLEVSGDVKAGNMNVERIIVNESGNIKSGNINAEDIELNGTITSGNVTCEVIWGNGKIRTGWLSCEENNLGKQY